MLSPSRPYTYLEIPTFPHSHLMSYSAEEHSKTFHTFPSMPEYLTRFSMLLSEDMAWIMKKADNFTSIHREEELLQCKEVGQDCVIDSMAGHRALSMGLSGQTEVEDRCLEQVLSLVLDEVLKDIETACKLLNITPGKRETERDKRRKMKSQLQTYSKLRNEDTIKSINLKSKDSANTVSYRK